MGIRTWSIDWCYCQWPWVILTTPYHPISTFRIAFHIFVVSGDRDFKFGTRRLTVASAGPWMANRPWKRRGQVMWTIKILVGTNHISWTANRLRCCQLRWRVSVVNWWRSRSPVYHTDRRHLCTTRWAWVTASRGSVSTQQRQRRLVTRATLCYCGICCHRVSVCLSACPFVTSRYCTKTAKCRISKTTPHNDPGTVVLRCKRSLRNSDWITPNRGAKCMWDMWKLRVLTGREVSGTDALPPKICVNPQPWSASTTVR